MIVKNALLPAEKAGQIQRTAGDFNCRLQGLAVAANKQAKVVVVGEERAESRLIELKDDHRTSVFMGSCGLCD